VNSSGTTKREIYKNILVNIPYSMLIAGDVRRSLAPYIEYFLRHGPCRKYRVQQFFYFCMCIRYSGNAFTEPLSSNVGGQGGTETTK
jgi:hypothetical protein